MISGMCAGAARFDALPAMRLEPVNGLRGIAILAVVYFHVICGMWRAAAVPTWLSPLVTGGWTGVNLFFILSGFVLFLPYAAGLRSMAAPRDRLAFYRRRFFRLLPVLSVAFTLSPHGFAPSFNPALWSIGVEIGFSAAFPLLVLAAGRYGLARVLAAALALALALRLVGIARFPALQGATFNSDMLLCRIDEFVIGMMLARLYVAGRLPRRPGLGAGLGAVLVVLAWSGFDRVLRGGLPPLARAGLNDVLDA